MGAGPICRCGVGVCRGIAGSGGNAPQAGLVRSPGEDQEARKPSGLGTRQECPLPAVEAEARPRLDLPPLRGRLL